MAERDKTWELPVNLKDFPRETLLEIKNYSDQHNDKREWLANVYYKDGKYILGSPVFGDYSGVSLKPDEQAVKDKFATGVKECQLKGYERGTCKNMMLKASAPGSAVFGAHSNTSFGASPEDLVATVHMHPIRQLETPGNKRVRSQFSGTDIGSEFAKAIRDGKEYKIFLAYPEAVGFGKRHTHLKMLKFPGKKSYEIMKASNPQLSDNDIASITVDGKGIEKPDWYAYQKTSAEFGYLQDIDIENTTGTQAFRAMGNYYVGIAGLVIVVALGVAWYLNRKTTATA